MEWVVVEANSNHSERGGRAAEKEADMSNQTDTWILKVCFSQIMVWRHFVVAVIDNHKCVLGRWPKLKGSPVILLSTRMALGTCTSYQAVSLGSTSPFCTLLYDAGLDAAFLLGHLLCVRFHQEETQEGDWRAGGRRELVPSCLFPTPRSFTLATPSHHSWAVPEHSWQFFQHLQNQLHDTTVSETPASADVWVSAP